MLLLALVGGTWFVFLNLWERLNCLAEWYMLQNWLLMLDSSCTVDVLHRFQPFCWEGHWRINFWPQSNLGISSFQESLHLLHCIHHFKEDYGFFWVSSAFSDQIAGPLLRRGLSLWPGILWKVAVESATCLEDTQTKHMWFVHKHKLLYRHMRALFMLQFWSPRFKRQSGAETWMSNVPHLSKYKPFTLRYNLFNVSVLKVNYRKKTCDSCEIHTMQYNCLDRFLWLHVWINLHTSHRFNKFGFFLFKKTGLKRPIANFLSNFHGCCPVIKHKSRQMQCYLLLLTQGTQKVVAHPHTDRWRHRKNYGGWWNLTVRASCRACGKVIVIDDLCFGFSNTTVLLNLTKIH